MSLLREIQNDLASPGGDVASVLRKCKILSARLGSGDLAAWVDLELNGYPEAQPIPEYRHLATSCYANFLNIAWRANKQSVPLAIVPEALRDGLRRVEFRGGIASVASFTRTGAVINRPELTFVLQDKMFPDMNCVSAWMEISGSEFEQLVSAVKNRILDFVLKIEAENPAAGEAPPNSHPVPEEKLRPLVNNFFGTIGNVSQNTHHAIQTTSIEIREQGDLARLVREFTDHIDELHLSQREKQRAEAQIATLQAQLTDDPDPLIVGRTISTLRNITEGAIGSLLATAAQPTIWHWIQQAMTALR